MLIHRFKNALVRSIRIQKDYPILAAISGGSNSMAMLNFLYNCLAGNKSQKRMFFKVHILYIDEGRSVFEWSEQVASDRRQMIMDLCKKYQFNLTILPLEAIYDVNRDLRNDVATEEELNSDTYKSFHADLPLNKVVNVEAIDEKRGKIAELLKTLEASFAADLVLYMKRWLIADFCLKFNFKKVILANSGHKVASMLLAQLAKGRGSSICNEVSFTDDKNFGGRVNFCSPLRDFLQKEIGLYNYI